MCFLSSKSRKYTKPPTKKYHRDPISGIMYPTSSTRRPLRNTTIRCPNMTVHIDEVSDGEDDYYGSYDSLVSARGRGHRLRFSEDEDRLMRLEKEYSAVGELKGWKAGLEEKEKLSAAEARGKIAGRAERDAQLKTEAEASAALEARIKKATEGTESHVKALEARVMLEDKERELRAAYVAGLGGMSFSGLPGKEGGGVVGAGGGYLGLGGPGGSTPPIYSAAAAAYAAPSYPSHPYLPPHPHAYQYAPLPYAPPTPASTPTSASPQRHIHEHNVRFENFDGNALVKGINSAASGLEKLSLEAMKSRNFQLEVEKNRERDRWEARERERRGRKVVFDDRDSEVWDN
ncbi:hypothetical protein B0J14DRAFT_565293 [Halenospora varia]|nr:hypothetical protein B0J14DRAFT_565293 [Halenospora varia]